MLRLRPTIALFALLWLQAISFVRAMATGDAGCNLFFCTNITISSDDMMSFEIKPIMEPFGWVAIGFGRRMKGTHMIILWDDNDGTAILSQRYGVGHVEPVLEPNPPRVATMIPPRESTTWEYKADTNFPTRAFQIPMNKTDPSPGTMIWAYSLRRPEDGPTSNLTGHYVAGTINMRLDKHVVEEFPGTIAHNDIVSGGSSFPSYSKAVWHGILVSVGFLVLLPTGSLLARWGRTFTPKWFQLHRTFNFYIALPVIAVGWLLGPLSVLDRHASHLSDAHQISGALLLAVYLTQIVLGRFIHAQHGKPNRAPHPPTNILHVVVGIIVIAGAFLQVRSGFAEWAERTGQPDVSSWCHTVWAVWGLVLPVLYFGGLALLKKQFAQEKKGATYEDTPTKNYIQLATTPAFDESEHDLDTPAMGRGYSELESGVPLLARGA